MPPQRSSPLLITTTGYTSDASAHSTQSFDSSAPQNTQTNSRLLLFLVKTLQFVSSLTDVAWNRYQPLLYLSQGYTPSQIGMLKTISFGTKFATGPIWSIAGDMYSPITTLILSYIIGMITLISVRSLLLTRAPFYMFVAVRMMRSASNAVGPLRDSITLECTHGRKDDESYGRQRMFASLAWGIGSYLGGWLIDVFGLWSVFPYTLGMGLLLGARAANRCTLSTPRTPITSSMRGGRGVLTQGKRRDRHRSRDWKMLFDAICCFDDV